MDALSFVNVGDLLEWPLRHEVPGMVFRRLISKHSALGVLGLSEAERVLWVVFELCGEVSNGGIEQYFSNSSRSRAVFLPDSLGKLGQPSLSALFSA